MILKYNISRVVILVDDNAMCCFMIIMWNCFQSERYTIQISDRWAIEELPDLKSN